MSEPNCTICRIVSGELPAAVVLENGDAMAFMDLRQPQPGHVLVVPRAHHVSLAELPTALGGALMEAAQRLIGALYRALTPAGINLYLNDGAAAGQELMHVHLHLQPRAAGDGLLAIRIGELAPAAELAALAARIRAGLNS